MPVNFLTDLLAANEQAVAFFTRGRQFVRRANNTGHTGSWLISGRKVVRNLFQGVTVIIYLETNAANTLWHAQCVAVQGPLTNGKRRPRYRLLLQNIGAAGVTNNSWSTFADTSRNPIRYVNF